MTTLMTQQQLHFVQVSPQKPLLMTLNFKLQKTPKEEIENGKLHSFFTYKTRVVKDCFAQSKPTP